MFYQYLLLHYAAKIYEVTRTARTEVPCYYWTCAWRYANAFIFTNQSEVDFGM